MATLIKNAKIATDSWQRLDWAADGGLPTVPATGDVLIPLGLWRGLADELLDRNTGRIGVWLDSYEDPAAIADSLDKFALVAVHFPQFADGRGYSIARLLRERHGWKGELRAIGDVQRDQLHYLARCGFDAFELNDGIDAQSALSAFRDFSDSYQAAVDQPLPLYRRRALEAA
ncbi:MAG: DUF934 domain-containing protein [Burkholderiales bacterium]|nr:DUF934 domain-containing protein [Burkholderiales bacterium]